MIYNESFTKGQPLVECGNEFIRFSVKTVRPFRGKVFVKGQHGNSDCNRNYSETDSTNTFHSHETANSAIQKRNDSLDEPAFMSSSQPLAKSIQGASLLSKAEESNPEAIRMTSTIHDYRFVTTKPHTSRHFDTASTTPHCPPCPICRDELKIEEGENTDGIADLLIRFGNCNVKYEQQTEPRAMIVSLTVIVSFHQNLLTKLDRAFRIQCAYMEGSETIDTDLSVSMPPSIDVESKINTPQCIYQVKSSSGKVITNARVGELIEHKWICQSPFKGVHAMLVRNCYAESNDNFKVSVIDDNGCTLDPYILPNLEYASDLLSVKVRAPVFKFPDRSDISFRCDPPKCANNKRRRRELSNISRESLILRTPRINIIDLDDDDQGVGSEQIILNPSLSGKSLRYCLTVTQFACIIASATFLITTTATLVGASIINSSS
uniref:BMA-CUTL-9 n=1 Tax=Brugia malayi TaxID=6279 RepID=A0A0J9XTL6_BRUMA|nr:BMA-CUTL-9 [Brugia malayi]